MASLGKFLVVLGAVTLVLGVLLLLSPGVPWLGSLPGDIVIRKKNFTFYAPIATSIILSIILTVLVNLFRR